MRSGIRSLSLRSFNIRDYLDWMLADDDHFADQMREAGLAGPPDEDRVLVSDKRESRELLKTLQAQDRRNRSRREDYSRRDSRRDNRRSRDEKPSLQEIDEDEDEGYDEGDDDVDSRGSRRHSYNVIDFEQNDKDNPHNWSMKYKLYISVVTILLVVNSTMGSSIPSGSVTPLAEEFGIESVYLQILPTSLYLIGYVIGPIIFAPLSESFGRWIIITLTFIPYTAFALGSALAPTWSGFLVFRALTGVGASTPISVAGGIFSDIFNNPKHRGNAMAIFTTVTLAGSLIGPLCSGYISTITWRWAYWLQLILAGFTWPFWLTVPETYSSIILYRRAKKLRRKMGDRRIVAPMELEKRSFKTLLTVTMIRPVKMFITEPIVLSCCIYMAFIYAIFYMYLQAFDLIYKKTYGFNAGQVGLTFLPMAVGAIFGLIIYLLWEEWIQAQRAKKDHPAWVDKDQYRRVALAAAGGPFMVISFFWLAWTARSDIYWPSAVLSSLPYSMAYVMIYVGLTNYIVDSYALYAASALAAASFSRSIFGLAMPFAVPPLFADLGIQWAVSTLGFIMLGMSAIPVAFIVYGDQIRDKSAMLQELRKMQEGKDDDGSSSSDKDSL